MLFAVAIVLQWAGGSPCAAQPATPKGPGHPSADYVPNPRVPLQADQYYPPKTVRLESGTWLVYELHLSNLYQAAIRLDGVEVRTDTVRGTILYQSSGESFAKQWRHLASPDDSVKTVLEPGQRGILFFWIPLPPRAPAPVRLYQRLLLQLQGKKMALDLTPLPVGKTEAVVLAPPIKGLWLVAQGVDPVVASTEGHNRLLYPYNGRIRLPQRFAVDWVRLGDSLKVFEGDSSRNENYAGYGADVYAVADGVVTEVQNDIPDNTPPLMTVPRTAKTITGNYLVLRMKNGWSAFYGHLKPGSIRIKPGTRVRAGQVLAQVGNTGNSTGAHLHFQLQDGPHYYDEGYPYVFASLLRQGRASKQDVDDMADHGRAFAGTLAPVALKMRMPVFGDIVLFR
ncbi:M23 family metallopeptidase [Flaviaesturariibacter terrae]